MEATVAASDLNSTGLLIDFRDFKKWLDEILEDMDHSHLNIIPSFADINPSAENIAKYICEKLDLKAKVASVNVVRVKIWESENAAVTYIPEQPLNPY